MPLAPFPPSPHRQKLYFGSEEAVTAYSTNPRAYWLSPFELPMPGMDGKKGLPDMMGEEVHCPYSNETMVSEVAFLLARQISCSHRTTPVTPLGRFHANASGGSPLWPGEHPSLRLFSHSFSPCMFRLSAAPCLTAPLKFRRDRPHRTFTSAASGASTPSGLTRSPPGCRRRPPRSALACKHGARRG